MTDINRPTCRSCGAIFMNDEEIETHDPDYCRRNTMSIDNVTMKPMLAEVLREALVLACIDSSFAPEIDEDGACWIGAYDTAEEWMDATEEFKRQWRANPYEIPLDRIDIEALAQNLAVRLLGSGGWFLNGVYTGNASNRDIFEKTFDRPDRNQTDEVAFDLMASGMTEPSTMKIHGIKPFDTVINVVDSDKNLRPQTCVWGANHLSIFHLREGDLVYVMMPAPDDRGSLMRMFPYDPESPEVEWKDGISG